MLPDFVEAILNRVAYDHILEGTAPMCFNTMAVCDTLISLISIIDHDFDLPFQFPAVPRHFQ
ncbi:hypothetical protein BOC52_11895 [Burkholderia pseudomallei]|nr:hypothetical protein BOC52_11895 [Burkholderia pseudomallei]